MAGGWATALGAAISGGAQGYQQGKEFQQQQLLNALRVKQAEQEQLLTQDKINELPKQHLESDLKNISDVQGFNKWNNPAWVAGQNQVVPGTVPTLDIAAARNAELAKNGFDSPAMTQDQLGQHFGVAPNTGASIPLADQVGQRDLQRKNALDDLTMKGYQNFASGGGYDMDPTTGQPANSAANRAKEIYDPSKGITSRYGSANDMPDNVAARDRAAAAAKAEVPPAMLQRVGASMGETIQNLNTAQRELERLYPGIATDPNKYNGTMDSLKAGAHRAMYGYFNTPYEKAIQNASLANIQEWSALVPGRINQAMVPYISNHQGDYGMGQSPSATYARNQGIIDMMTNNRTELFKPQMAAAPQAAAPQQPVVGPQQPPLGQVNPADVAGQLPQAAPQATAGPSAKAGSYAPKPGDTMTYAEVVALTKGTSVDPNQLAASLKARGVNVVNPAAKPAVAKPSVVNPQAALGKATSIGPEPQPAPWTMDSLLHKLGIQ